MLGLVAHGLHLLLVVLGLAGVAALLLPQAVPSTPSLRRPSFRTDTFRPPSTPAEHERRVAALRAAVLAYATKHGISDLTEARTRYRRQQDGLDRR